MILNEWNKWKVKRKSVRMGVDWNIGFKGIKMDEGKIASKNGRKYIWE
jgi:hypothetical protein